MTLVKHSSPRLINDLFDEVFRGFPTTWGNNSHTNTVSPSVNIHETTDAYVLELNAAGLSKEDLKVNAENDLLTISYDKKEEAEHREGKTIRREFTHRSFKRSFSLDEKINVEVITAKYDNGILKLNLPKKEEVKFSPKEISILKLYLKEGF